MELEMLDMMLFQQSVEGDSGDIKLPGGLGDVVVGMGQAVFDGTFFRQVVGMLQRGKRIGFGCLGGIFQIQVLG